MELQHAARFRTAGRIGSGLRFFQVRTREELNAAALLAIALVSGCASISVNRVDPKTGEIANPRAPQGIHYYMARPYVAVHDPFVLTTEIFVARGVVSPDGKYLRFSEYPTGLFAPDHAVAADPKAEQVVYSIQAVDNLVGPLHQSDGAPQAGTVPAVPADTSKAAKADAPAALDSGTGKSDTNGKATAPASKDAAATSTATGIADLKATVDPAAAITSKLSGPFDITWLPDWEQEYVIQVSPGLGNSSTTITLGQGWYLQGIDAHLDNTAVAKPIVDALSNISSAASQAISGSLGVLAKASPSSGGPQSGLAPEKGLASGATGAIGAPVYVRIAKVRMVPPGLYKILKPTEATAALALSDEQSQRIVLPIRPYTDIAFSTYDALLVEAITPAGAAPGSSALPSPTDDGSKKQQPPQVDGCQKPDPQSSNAQTDLKTALAAPDKVTTDQKVYEPTVCRSSDATPKWLVILKVGTAAKAGKAKSLPTGDALKAFVVSTLASKDKITVDPSDVTLP